MITLLRYELRLIFYYCGKILRVVEIEVSWTGVLGCLLYLTVFII